MCMTLIAGKAASKTGRVLVGHNEDDYVHASVRHYLVPAMDWPSGTVLPAEPDNVCIPQVPHTASYWWMQVRGPEGGLSTADSFFNEHGVCVVSDSSCGSHEDACAGEPAKGGIVYELRRAVAERAASARDGLKIAIELIRDYGYASPGRMYTIADKQEAFMLQVVRGHRYLAARVPDDALVILPNHYTFHTLTDAEEMFYPDDLVSHAAEMNWFDPEKEPFDFAAAYQDPKTYLHPENTLRQKYATALLTGKESEGYPFCVKAVRKVGAEDIMRALSTHYEGSPDDPRTGLGASPHYTGVRRVCTGTTVESAVYEMDETAEGTTVWTSFGRPCTLPYLPLHPLCGVPEELEKPLDPIQEAQTHLIPIPGATAHRDDLWQRFQDFENGFDLRYSDLLPRVQYMKNRLQGDLARENARLKGADRETLHAFDKSAVIRASEALPEVLNAEILSAVFTCDHTVRVEFVCPCAPDIRRLYFGPGRLEPQRDFVRASGLKRTEKGWQADFRFETRPLTAVGPGEYEFFLTGAGFAAQTIMELQ